MIFSFGYLTVTLRTEFYVALNLQNVLGRTIILVVVKRRIDTYFSIVSMFLPKVP